MYNKILQALKYPESDTFNINDDNHLKKVVVWLEKNVLKKCKSANINNLTNINSSNWSNTYNLYKQDLSCPITTNVFLEEIQWLLGYALRQPYKDTYSKSTEVKSASNVPNIVTENVIDRLNFAGEEFQTGITTLAKLLKITPHPNNMVTLEAIRKQICNRYNAAALKNPNDFIVKGTPLSLDEINFSTDTKNLKVNKAAKALLLLYIKSLRDLQTQANELIVASQNITANPKTDTKLGKVGV